jgi:DNA repair exonuclease SbcCD ATPase subunit
MLKYVFNKINLNNFFHYSNQEVPLDNQGLVIVTGWFGSKYSSNAAGKSLLFSSIPLLLHGELPTGKSSKSERKDLDLSLESRIISRRDRPVTVGLAKSKYSIQSNGRDITPRKQRDTKELIRKVFPEETIFYSSCMVSQFSTVFQSLIWGTPAVRSRVIREFIDLSKIEGIRETVKEKDQSFQEDASSLSTLKNEYKEIKEELEELEGVDKEALKRILKLRDQVGSQHSKLSKKLTEERARYKDYRRQKKLKKRLKLKDTSSTKVKNEIKGKKDKLNHAEGIKERITSAKSELSLYLKLGEPTLFPYSATFTLPEIANYKVARKHIPIKGNLTTLSKRYRKLRKTIASELTARKRIKKLIDRGARWCPTCLHKLTEDELLTIYNKLYSKIDEPRTKAHKIMPRLMVAKAIGEIHEAFEEHSISSGDIGIYRNKTYRKEIGRQIKKLTRETDFLEKQLPMLEHLETVGEGVPEKDNRKIIKETEKELEKLSAIAEKVLYRLMEIKSKYKRKKELLTRAEKVKAKYVKLRKRTKEDALYLPIISKAVFSRDLYTEVLMNFCESLTDSWNIYVPELFGRKIHFSVGIERGFPSFKYAYGKKGSPVDIRFLSGGEKRRLIIAIIPSILMMSPATSNILILDEVDANMDDKGVAAILEFLPTILEAELGKTSIFFITPRTGMTHQDYRDWRVTRKGNRSKLTME